MTGGARPGADVPAASRHEAAARPGDTAAGPVAVPAGGRVRPASRRGWPWVWALASGVAAAAAVRVPGAASDVRAAFAHAGGLRVSWLGVAVAAEVASLAGGAAAQRRLLSAAGVSLPWRTVSGVVFASTGLAGLPVPWRGLLFAYAAGQLAGRLVPLPGGLGGVEGGVLGALTLTGTPPAAAAAAVIIYRVAGYWAVGAAGTAAAATLGRRRSRGTGGEAPQQPAGCVDQGQDGVPALAALTEPARTAQAAGQGPRPPGPCLISVRRPGRAGLGPKREPATPPAAG